MPKSLYLLLFLFVSARLCSQTNILPNGDFETYSACPNSPGNFSICTGWTNCNLNYGMGLWGTPDYFNTCGSNGYAPPATFSGTCAVHSGSAMCGIVVYNTPYTDYREYISRQLSSPMLPGNTYTFSFWITNGTGIKSPWAIKNIGACFTASALPQSGYSVISATPQCEVTSVIATTVWTQYTFTVIPNATWNYVTFGAFRNDVANTPTLVFPNPGGPPSVYANYFIDDMEIWGHLCTPPTVSVSANPLPVCNPGGSTTLTATGAIAYTWSPAASLSSNTGSAVIASPTISTIYTLTATNGSCTTNIEVPLTIQAATLAITPAVSSVCPGAAVSLTASGCSTYTWLPGVTTSSTVVYNPTVTSSYTVLGTNSVGCTTSSVFTIPVLPAPSLSVTASGTVCQSAITIYSATATQSASTYWLPFSSTQSSSTYTFNTSTPGTTTFSVLAQAPNGCSTTVTRSIQVIPKPIVMVLPASQTVCAQGSLTLTAMGANQFTWFPGSLTGSILNVGAPANNTSYTVIGLSAQGCTNTAVSSVTVVPLPILNASSNPTTTCVGGSSTLTCSGATNYTWSPGTLSGSVVIVSPLSTTIYTITGEDNGCRSQTTVIVSNPVNPQIIRGGEISCTQPSLQLTAASSSSQNVLVWSGTGITGITSSAVFVNTAGIYSLTVLDPISNCIGIATVQVLNTIAPLNLSIVPSSTQACYPGPAVNLLASTPASYTWYPQSSVSPPVGPLVSVNPSVTTSYTVEAIQGICSGSAIVTISVVPLPTLNLNASSQTLCAGNSVTLSAEGADTYVWEPLSLSGSSIQTSPLVTTVYTVSGYVGSCLSTQQLTLNVLARPQITLTASPGILCTGNTSTLTAISTDTVYWPLLAGNSNSSTLVVLPFGNSTYTAIAVNASGCKTEATVAVIALSSASIQAQSSQTVICAGTSVSLSASGSNNFTWAPGNLSGSEVVITPSVSTVYTVYTSVNGCGSYTTVAISVNNCGNRTFGLTSACSAPEPFGSSLFRVHFTVTAVNPSNTDLVNVLLWDDLNRTFSDPCTFTVSNNVEIKPSSSKLKANNFFDGNLQNALSSAASSTLGANSRDTLLFTVVIDPRGFSGRVFNTVIGEALRADGLIVADSSNNGFQWDPDLDGDPTNNNILTPIDIPPRDLFIPDAFSPDGNGQNDLFVIKGLNGRTVKLEIFNRWGNMVYRNENYDNTWDGTMNMNSPHFGSGKLPNATYYYVLEFKDGQREIYHGFVILKY